jgi:hypothetical protein
MKPNASKNFHAGKRKLPASMTIRLVTAYNARPAFERMRQKLQKR